jgi:hypothetical protein
LTDVENDHRQQPGSPDLSEIERIEANVRTASVMRLDSRSDNVIKIGSGRCPLTVGASPSPPRRTSPLPKSITPNSTSLGNTHFDDRLCCVTFLSVQSFSLFPILFQFCLPIFFSGTAPIAQDSYRVYAYSLCFADVFSTVFYCTLMMRVSMLIPHDRTIRCISTSCITYQILLSRSGVYFPKHISSMKFWFLFKLNDVRTPAHTFYAHLDHITVLEPKGRFPSHSHTCWPRMT